MRALFVAPMLRSSGEAATVGAMVHDLEREGHEAYVLASSPLVEAFGQGVDAPTRALGHELAANQALWSTVVTEFRPSHVVFADFPMLAGFPSGVAKLCSPSWIADLLRIDAELVTLDHLGYGQGPMSLFFGPAHLCRRPVEIPSLPDRMRSLLPCPVHEPGPVVGRRGLPFTTSRSVAPPCTAKERQQTRARLGASEGVMVLHCASAWMHRFCRAFDLPYFSLLPRLLDEYFRDAPEPVTVVSVNGFEATERPTSIRLVSLPSMGAREFSAVLSSSDLFLNENPFSSALGRAVNLGIPAVSLANSYTIADVAQQPASAVRSLAFELEEHRPGSLFPYRVFPLDFREELTSMQLFRCNRFERTFRVLEAWGGAPTRDGLHDLLWGRDKNDVSAAQQDYSRSLAGLPLAAEALLAGGGSP